MVLKLTFLKLRYPGQRPESPSLSYYGSCKDISIYECSIFDFSAKVAGGQFDCIWDRGSMTAINMMTDERVKKYRDQECSTTKFSKGFISFLNNYLVLLKRFIINFPGKKVAAPQSQQDKIQRITFASKQIH